MSKKDHLKFMDKISEGALNAFIFWGEILKHTRPEPNNVCEEQENVESFFNDPENIEAIKEWDVCVGDGLNDEEQNKMTKQYCPLYFDHILKQALRDNHPTYKLARKIDEKVIGEFYGRKQND